MDDKVAATHRPQLSIIVVSYNTREMTLACLDSVVRETLEVDYQLIVVDNASTDGSQEAIKKHHPDIDLVCNDTNLGAIGGRNAAVEYAKRDFDFDYVLFLDDDAETAVDSIQLLVNALDSDPGVE